MKASDILPERTGKVVIAALAAEKGIYTLEQVALYTEKELLAIHGVGPKGVRIIKEELAKRNMSLKTVQSKRTV